MLSRIIIGLILLGAVNLHASQPHPHKRPATEHTDARDGKRQKTDELSKEHGTTTHSSSTDFPKGGLGLRPVRVQKNIDFAFELVKTATAANWAYKGITQDYKLCNINTVKLIKYAVSQAREKTVNIVDVGCGKAALFDHVMKILSEDTEIKSSSKEINLISITGGLECDNELKKIGNVIHRKLNQVKIENIDEESRIEDLNLKNNVDLIFSRWVFKNLIDPLGAFKRQCSLLKQHGILVTDELWYYVCRLSNNPYSMDQPTLISDKDIEAQTPIQRNTIEQPSLFTSINASVLCYDGRCDTDDFETCGMGLLLQRHDTRPLSFPAFEYTEEEFRFRGYVLSYSVCMPIYKEISQETVQQLHCFKESHHCNNQDCFRKYYCNNKSQESKKLYETLKKANVFL
jgi:hypothetical protein